MNHVEQKKGALHIGWWYRILLLSSLFHLFTFSPLQAQRIRTIDKDGQPVPYVSVLTTDAKFIGITDLDGVIEDVKGADQASGERKFSLDTHKMSLHSVEAGGKAKKIAKQEKRDAKKKNKQDVHFTVYQIDEAGNYSPEDFVMSENMTSYDEEKDGKNVHTVMDIQVFTTDRAYVDKDELKQKKKENKMKMTYQNIRQFERANKIPALTPVIQKKLDELWKADN